MAIITGDEFNNLINGTGNDDTLLGLGGDDVLFGSSGDDLLNGGEGTDTANYGNFNRAITLKSQGAIEKGSSTDEILDIESIVGAVGKRNLIDGTVPGGGPARFDIDLSTNDLAVLGIPGLGAASFKVFNFADINGTANNDRLLGDNKDNVFGGSAGDDLIDGQGGKDTVDYTALNAAVTLERAGTINKGKAGTDQLLGIETIVGANGFDNAIDGGTGVSGTTSFDLDLSSESLSVKGIPGLGAQSFTIKNFVNATGTSNDDKLVGDRKNNVFTGSLGDDLLDGKNGKDTADYTGLGEAITLRRVGVVDKGDAGGDTIVGIETIIGDAGLDNRIDGNDPGNSGVTSFTVNLAANKLTVKNVPGIGSAKFKVENFVDVVGTVNNDSLTGDKNDNILIGFFGRDRIFGNDGDDRILGGAGADKLFGGAGDDRFRGGLGNDLIKAGDGDDFLIGVNATAKQPGLGERDRLVGGSGADIFAIGDSDGVFYGEGKNSDFATIADLESGIDKILLSGTLSSYVFDEAKKRIFWNGDDGLDLLVKSQRSFNVKTDFAFTASSPTLTKTVFAPAPIEFEPLA
ncbi:MAG: calcium-binding protein [Cyanobacteria bacterium P01_D01_bin.36]